MKREPLFATEAELVATFCDLIHPRHWATNPAYAPKWTPYHETSGWDLLLVHETGIQIGIEAKLSLNAKVLDQALPHNRALDNGPDYRAVLVPADSLQHHLISLARHVGITIIRCRPAVRTTYSLGMGYFNPDLPDEKSAYCGDAWPNWCPAVRCALPDYVPDVTGGHSAPVQLTPWKIKAIKLMVVLERAGAVSRADMKALGISPTRWTDHYNGFLSPGPHGGYVRNGRTPDLKAQHPTNWAQIEADFDTWSRGVVTAARLHFGATA